MRYMLDTNICIYLMRQSPPAVVRRFEAASHGDICMSAITLAELRCGVRSSSADPSRLQQVIERLKKLLVLLPFDDAAAFSYGNLYQAIRDRRRDALDRLIAAHAISAECVLVTNNEQDFRDYPGLTIENWLD